MIKWTVKSALSKFSVQRQQVERKGERQEDKDFTKSQLKAHKARRSNIHFTALITCCHQTEISTRTSHTLTHAAVSRRRCYTVDSSHCERISMPDTFTCCQSRHTHTHTLTHWLLPACQAQFLSVCLSDCYAHPHPY